MRTKSIALVVSITLVLVALVTVVQTLPPSPLPANAPAAEFSAERAIHHIQVIAAQPRPTGSSAYHAAQNYVLGVLNDLGFETETQRSGAFQNTIGWIEGNSSPDIVLLTAHLDTAAGSPGATDDGSGIAVLLETARAVISDAPLQNTVMFLFTDSEEEGCLGAKAFIEHHPRAQDIGVVINFDAGGISGPGGVGATSANNGWLIRQLAQADPHIVGSSAINALAVSNEDFSGAFRIAGYSGYAFGLYWDNRIHTPEDSIENLNPSSIQHQGYHALSLARHFGNLNPLADPKEPDAIYFSVLRLFMVSYSSRWAIPMAIAVLGIWGGLLAYGLRRRILSWGGMGYGAFVLLAGLLIAPLPHLLLGTWIHDLTSQVADRSLHQPLQVSVTVFIALALTILWYSLSRRIRKTSIPDLSMGALAPMALGMAGTSLALPALSYAFTWPLLLTLLACVIWFYSYGHQTDSKMAILGLLFSGTASIVIVGWVVVMGLFALMSLSLVLLGVLCGFLVPQIHLMLGSTIDNPKPMQEPRAE